MKRVLTAMMLSLAVLAGACDENAPPDRDSRSTGIFGNPPASAAPGSPHASGVADSIPVPPAGAAWTIFCDTATGPDHVESADQAKARLIALTHRSDFYLIHQDNQSSLYFGFYKDVKDAAAQADLRMLRSLVSTNGDPLFREPILLPVTAPDPDAPPEWNLANAPADAFWSLQIAAYKDTPDRKKAAVDAVREARKLGIPAYYYHGDSISSVCVGLWPSSAVKNQGEGNPHGNTAYSDDPNQPIMVLGGSRAPDNLSPDLTDADGNKVKIMGIKIEIVDQTLKAAIARYPHESVNGEEHYHNVNGLQIYDESFLVQVPHSKLPDATAEPTAGNNSDPGQPAAPDDSLPPDPTQGALRSLGDK